ncbi:hypothetical protein Tco_1071594 [Tanacetum coccineum]
MEDEHLNTIPETESDEENESSIKDLNLTPSESEDLSEDLSDYKSECDMPVCDDSISKNEGLDDIISIPPGKEIDQLDAIPYLVQSLLNRANSIIFLIEEFVEIDVFLAPDDSIPPGIENDDYDSEGDVLFLEELLNDDSISLLEYESFHFDFPSSPRPPEKPPNDDVYFDIEPDTGVLTTKVVDDISDNSTRELYVHLPNVLPTHPTLYPVFDTLLPFSFENEDKLFNPGILISKKEKSPHFLSHRGFKALQIIYDFSESPMMICGEDIPILDVPFLHFYPP